MPVRSVVLQEHYDSSMSGGLLKLLEEDGVLMNPPIVAAMGRGRYLHLDGANRITSLQALGFPHILVQVVDYFDPSVVRLKSWSHVSTVDEEVFVRLLRKIPEVRVASYRIGRGLRASIGTKTVCHVVFADAAGFIVLGNGDLLDRVKFMNQVFDLYRHLVVRDQEDVIFDEETLTQFFARHKGRNVALFFPTFTPYEVFEVVRSGAKFPAGVTRHIISFRALRVNFPLRVLKSRQSLARKRAFLKTFLEKIEWRVYEEPVVMGER